MEVRLPADTCLLLVTHQSRKINVLKALGYGQSQ